MPAKPKKSTAKPKTKPSKAKKAMSSESRLTQEPPPPAGLHPETCAVQTSGFTACIFMPSASGTSALNYYGQNPEAYKDAVLRLNAVIAKHKREKKAKRSGSP